MPDPFAGTSVALLALGVGAAHMLAPDHWVPLTVYCHAKNLSFGRSALIAAAGGFAHVVASIITMAVAVIVGFALASGLSQISNYVVGASFAAIAAYMVLSGLRAKETEEGRAGISRGVKWMVLATASSPELTIFPIYLSASVLGSAEVVASISAFAVGTVVAIMLVTLAGLRGVGVFLRKPGREKQIDYAIAFVMAALAVLAFAGG